MTNQPDQPTGLTAEELRALPVGSIIQAETTLTWDSQSRSWSKGCRRFAPVDITELAQTTRRESGVVPRMWVQFRAVKREVGWTVVNEPSHQSVEMSYADLLEHTENWVLLERPDEAAMAAEAAGETGGMEMVHPGIYQVGVEYVIVDSGGLVTLYGWDGDSIESETLPANWRTHHVLMVAFRNDDRTPLDAFPIEVEGNDE